MGRKPVIQCSLNPYHVTARTNNKDWFDLDMDYVFGVYCNVLKESISRYKIRLHAFVLMINHFHMMATTPEGNISEFLQYFMTQTSKAISKKSGRINKVYGGRNYKSLIRTEQYYATCLKYIALNPVRAGVCDRVEDYKWSTFSKYGNEIQALCVEPENGHNSDLPKTEEDLLRWLNDAYDENENEIVRRASRRMEFEIKSSGGYRKMRFPCLPN